MRHDIGLAVDRSLQSAKAQIVAKSFKPAFNVINNNAKPARIHIIEDNFALREAARQMFETEGWAVSDYVSAEDFLKSAQPEGQACLLIDVMLPGMSGLELLALMQKSHPDLPAIMLTGRSDAKTAVAAMKSGASDYIEKPADHEKLIASVANALTLARQGRALKDANEDAKAQLDTLTPRERDVLAHILDGMPNKNIAFELGLNQRTVENHRANVLRKTGSRGLADLVKLCMLADRAAESLN